MSDTFTVVEFVTGVAGCLFGLFLLICVILGLHDIVFWVNEYFGWM